MGWSILAPEHIVHRAEATNPKSHSHTFSVSEIRDFGAIFRLIRILDLVTEKGNDTRHKIVPYWPECMYEYMMWFKSCDVKISRGVSQIGSWWIDAKKSWEDCQMSHLSEVGVLYLIVERKCFDRSVIQDSLHYHVVQDQFDPFSVLSHSQLSTLLLKWYLLPSSASRCTCRLGRAIKSCSSFYIHVNVDKICAAIQQLLQPQQCDSETRLKRQKVKTDPRKQFQQIVGSLRQF